MDIKKSFDIALKKRNMTKRELAEKAKVTQPYITQVTRSGSLSVRRLDELAGFLGYKLWEFVKLADEKASD